jgi:hypothetical protein
MLSTVGSYYWVFITITKRSTISVSLSKIFKNIINVGNQTLEKRATTSLTLFYLNDKLKETGIFKIKTFYL